MNRREVIKSKKLWIISLVSLTTIFIFLGWIAFPKALVAIIPLTIAFSLISIFIPIEIIYRKEKMFFHYLNLYLAQPEQSNILENLLEKVTNKECEVLIKTLITLKEEDKDKIQSLFIKNQNYSNYIEVWVHEIKTPLALMSLLLDNNSKELSKEIYTKLKKSELMIQNQVQQVLYYSKTQVSHKDFIFKRESLDKLCKSTIRKKAEILLESRVKINIKEVNHDVITDKKCFDFILGQIIDNSIKYMGSYSKKNVFKNFNGEITFLSEVKENIIIFSIIDNGPGVSKAEIPFIFDKGFVGSNGRINEKSTGMGLYICKELCKQLGIEIKSECRNGEGLKIIMYFPIVN